MSWMPFEDVGGNARLFIEEAVLEYLKAYYYRVGSLIVVEG